MYLTQLHFPEITLSQRDGHKLRGYIAKQFGTESDQFHNHQVDGKTIYRYPSIQYKIIERSPMLVGIQDGARLLTERFLRLKELEINGKIYPLQQKNMKSEDITIGISNSLFTYEFLSPWQALNQKNFNLYRNMTEKDRKHKLNRILINNMISFFKTAGYQAEQQVMVTTEVWKIDVQFKNQLMVGFKGRFTCNVELPDYIGLGKSVSRGFGTIRRFG